MSSEYKCITQLKKTPSRPSVGLPDDPAKNKGRIAGRSNLFCAPPGWCQCLLSEPFHPHLPPTTPVGEKQGWMSRNQPVDRSRQPDASATPSRLHQVMTELACGMSRTYPTFVALPTVTGQVFTSSISRRSPFGCRPGS